MDSGFEAKDYWLLRLAQAMRKAVIAPSDRLRSAHLDLARHYWSMHVMINGRGRPADFKNFDVLIADLAAPKSVMRSGSKL